MDSISNNKAEDYGLNQDNQSITLFRFELNQTQSIIVLIFALTGLFLIPFLLGGEIFFNLFTSLFLSLPSYLSHPEYYADLYLFLQLFSIISNLIIYSLFFCFSFVTVRKILRGLGGEGTQKSKIIPQDRIVRWLGLKLSHGQAIFIFCLSLLGISYLSLQIIKTIVETIGSNHPPFDMFYTNLLSIPTGQNRATSYDLLLYNVPFILNGLFLVLCLYSIFVTRRGKKSHSNQIKTASNLGVFIFIGSFLISLLYLMRFLTHLFMFTDLGHLVGISKESTNIYQFNDFLNVVIILIGSFSFLVFSCFLKKKTKHLQKENENLTWFHVKLTKNRYFMLLSYSIMFSCLLGYFFANMFFNFGIWGFYVEILIFYLITFLLILYSSIKITSKNSLQRILSQFNASEDFKVNWYRFRVNRLQSVILCSVSSGAMLFYMFEMVTFRSSFQFELTYLDMLWVIQMISMLAFLSLLLLFALYTIKCSYKGVKSP